MACSSLRPGAGAGACRCSLIILRTRVSSALGNLFLLNAHPEPFLTTIFLRWFRFWAASKSQVASNSCPTVSVAKVVPPKWLALLRVTMNWSAITSTG
jgi:hypothetical protein